MKIKCHFLFFVLLLSTTFFGQQKKSLVLPNENLITENIPEITKELASQVKKYSEARGASVVAIHPTKNEIIISTRFGTTAQLHKVSKAMGARTQITFFDEPVGGATFEPTKGEYLIYSRDAGGNEFGQLYKFDIKTLQSTLLTDGWTLQMVVLIGKKTEKDSILCRPNAMVVIVIFIIWIQTIRVQKN